MTTLDHLAAAEAARAARQQRKYSVACPHPECQGTLQVPFTLPAGEYRCLCHACRLSLSWTFDLEHGDYTLQATLVQ